MVSEFSARGVTGQHMDILASVRMFLNFGIVEYVCLMFYSLFYIVAEVRPGWLNSHVIHKEDFRKSKSTEDVVKTSAKVSVKAPVKAPVKNSNDVPGPTPRIPILGTRWIFSSLFGSYKLAKIHDAYADLFRIHGPIVREESLWNYPVISLLDREAIEKVLRFPTKWPLRPPTEISVHYRKSRPDRYTDLGIVNEQGESWHRLRSIFAPEIMSTKTMLKFNPELNLVVEDFNTLLRQNRTDDGRVADFELFGNRLALESICTLVLGRRMGFLDKQVDSKVAELAEAVHGLFRSVRDTYYGLPFWKIFPSQAYTQMVKSEGKIYDIVSILVEEALQEEQNTCAVDDGIQSVFRSILRTPELDIRDKRANIIDTIAAGIQTLGNTFVFILYLIAKHPEAQQRLYEEVVNIAPRGSPITTEDLTGAKYLRACVRESFRVIPTAPCVARILAADMELSGYNLDAGTVILCHTWLACQQEANFTDAKKFKPERWLPESKESMVGSKFIALPFGGGKRMCPGKRFAEQLLHLTLAKVIQEFHVEFEGELDIKFEFLNTPDGPIKFSFRDRS